MESNEKSRNEVIEKDDDKDNVVPPEQAASSPDSDCLPDLDADAEAAVDVAEKLFYRISASRAAKGDGGAKRKRRADAPAAVEACADIEKTVRPLLLALADASVRAGDPRAVKYASDALQDVWNNFHDDGEPLDREVPSRYSKRYLEHFWADDENGGLTPDLRAVRRAMYDMWERTFGGLLDDGTATEDDLYWIVASDVLEEFEPCGDTSLGMEIDWARIPRWEPCYDRVGMPMTKCDLKLGIYYHPGTGTCLCRGQRGKEARDRRRPVPGCPGVSQPLDGVLPNDICHGCLFPFKLDQEQIERRERTNWADPVYCPTCTGRCCACSELICPDRMFQVDVAKYRELLPRSSPLREGGIEADAKGRALLCIECLRVEGVDSGRASEALWVEGDETNDSAQAQTKDEDEEEADRNVVWYPPRSRLPPAKDDGTCFIIGDAIRAISYYYGSRMAHKGAGFDDWCDFLGSDFRQAYYNVKVSDEVNKVISKITEAKKSCLANVDPSKLQKRSYEIVQAWDEYTEGEPDPMDPSHGRGSTLESFWHSGSGAGVELHEIRGALFEAWDEVFTSLLQRGKLTGGHIDWILAADEKSLFFNHCSPSLCSMLATKRRARLLCNEGATFSNLMDHLRSLPKEGWSEELRCLILYGAPERTDPADHFLGLNVRAPGELGITLGELGIIYRVYGSEVGINGTDTLYQIHWLNSGDDEAETKYIRTQTVNYEELMTMYFDNFTRRQQQGEDAPQPFVHRRYGRCPGEGYIIDAREVEAAREFSELLWGKEAVADRTTALHVANELQLWRMPCRLMRELYTGMAQPTGVPELALIRARRELLSEKRLCMQELARYVLMSIWDDVVLRKDRIGNEKSHVRRVMKMATKFGKLLDKGKIPDDPGDFSDRVSEMLDDIWFDVRDAYWDRLDDYEDDDMFGFVPRKDEMFEMDRPKDASNNGMDFCCKKEGNMDEDAEWPHFHEPIIGWFRIAALAMNKSTKEDENKAKRLAFVTEWRDTLLATLCSADICSDEGDPLGFAGKDLLYATLALFAAMEKCNIRSPIEWRRLCRMMTELRKGPKELCEYFFGDA